MNENLILKPKSNNNVKLLFFFTLSLFYILSFSIVFEKIVLKIIRDLERFREQTDRWIDVVYVQEHICTHVYLFVLSIPTNC